MYRLTLVKPDGRNLILFSRTPIDPGITATSPTSEPVDLSGLHLRWHPFRGEWVSYARHRQNRTYLPKESRNPLAPTISAGSPTELPSGRYDVAVFENMFPALNPTAFPAPTMSGVQTMPALGTCEVVVYSQDASGSLGILPVDHISLIIKVWGDRYLELGARPEIQYILTFENRGKEVGVTLHHPHGQIYAYPFVPPVPANELHLIEVYFREKGRTQMADYIHQEKEAKKRILFEDDSAIAFVPACARYTYEVWITPKRSMPSLADLYDDERLALSRALKTVLLKYDGLWNRPFPYLMFIHQAPTDNKPHPEYHTYIELCPAFRSPDRLKFLAGTELGAGMFANDSFPEEKAKELQNVRVDFNG